MQRNLFQTTQAYITHLEQTTKEMDTNQQEMIQFSLMKN